MIPQRDIVIFLGAGFSYYAGLPVMANFGPASREDYNGLQKHLSERNERVAAKMLIHAAEIFYKFRDYCHRSPTITSADADNLETIFCIAEVMREAGLTKITLQNKDYLLKDLTEDIKLWLWKIYQQCPISNPEREMVNPDRKTRNKIYEKFFSHMDERICKRTTFISTNYDIIFEYMSSKNGKPCGYPGRVHKIELGNGPNYVCVNNDPGAKFELCKLHGSVNFFEDNSNELFISVDLAGGKKILNSSIRKDLPAIFAVDAIEKIRQDFPSLTPAIIPPTYAKLEGKEWLRKIWNNTFNALSSANTIVFIGYSMPPTDGFMRALIHAALASETRTNMPAIFVIDPNSEVHENYSKLFGASYRDIGRHTLEWALEEKVLEQVLEFAIKKSA